MAIPVSSSGGQEFERIKPDNYVARCYEMIHIGTVPEEYMGEKKMQNKVRISWELPNHTKVWKEGEEAKPHVISKEYTASLGDKANLRKMLASWRGRDFTVDELKLFDLEKLVGAPCMLNIIERTNQKGDKVYSDIGSVSKLPKEITCPAQVNESSVLSFDKFDLKKFESLPDFIKDKVKSSIEYKAMMDPHQTDIDQSGQTTFTEEEEDTLPF